MTRSMEGGSVPLQQRAKRGLDVGQRCVSCLVRVVEEEGQSVPPQVQELAPNLDRGIGGSGAVCGVFVAALLAAALRESPPPAEGDTWPASPAPRTEWLDAFMPPPWQHTVKMERCASLARRLTTFARERFGGVECQGISGVEWPAVRPGQAGLYLTGEGAERCARFIAEAAQAYLDSLSAEGAIPR